MASQSKWVPMQQTLQFHNIVSSSKYLFAGPAETMSKLAIHANLVLSEDALLQQEFCGLLSST